ncbi:MAG: hypothetical protein JRF43_05450 [Deltaproteobacteria bacterium]|nr:hypothetical protein [Deltaproteobacteria bacterium]
MGEDWVFFLKLSTLYPFGFAPEVITLRLLHEGSLCCLTKGGMEIRNKSLEFGSLVRMHDAKDF